MSSAVSHSGWMEERATDPTRRAAGGRPEWSRRERRQFRWMVALAFPLLLLIATIARLSGWWWRPWPPGPAGYRSVVAEAREAAEVCIGFAFVGW